MKFENATITGHFGFVFEENSVREITDYLDAVVFDKHRFQNGFRPREIAKLALSNFSGLKSVFTKLRFRDGLVGRNKAALSNFSDLV